MGIWQFQLWPLCAGEHLQGTLCRCLKETYRAKVFACTERPKLKLPDLAVRPAWHKAGSNGFRSACARVYVLRESVSGRCRLVILCVQRCRLPHEGGVWVSFRLVGDVRPGRIGKKGSKIVAPSGQILYLG